MEKKKSIYETQRAIGHPIDLLGNPVNVKKAKKRLDIDLKEIYNYISEINNWIHNIMLEHVGRSLTCSNIRKSNGNPCCFGMLDQ